MSKRTLSETKIVRRTWVTASGEVKTSVYEYKASKYRAKSEKLVAKTGRIFKRANDLQALGITEVSPARALIAKASKEGRTLTVSQLKAQLSKNRLEIMLTNTGFDTSYLARKAGVSEETLLTDSNWIGRFFTDPATGKKWEVTYTYDGDSTFREV